MPLTVPPIEPIARHFLDRDRLASNHRLVDRALPFRHDAIDRHLLARPDAQAVAHLDVLERDVFFEAVLAQSSRGLGSKSEKGLDRARGLAAGPELEHLTEQHERGDDRRRLEINRHLPMMIAERIGEDAWKERRHHAVDEGRSGAHRDQREHVEAAVDQRSPAACEERKPAPQNHGSREGELNPRETTAQGGVGSEICPPSTISPIARSAVAP